MKIQSMLICLIVAVAVIMWASPAISQMKPQEKIKAFEGIIDNFIDNCSKKSAMIDSSSTNIRDEARTALMKASFYKKNKEILVEEMMKNNIAPKSYTVQHFLNERFFAIVRDHNPKVAEAYSEPDDVYVPVNRK